MQEHSHEPITVIRDGAQRTLCFHAPNGTVVEQRPIPPGISVGSLPQPWLHCAYCYRDGAHPYAIPMTEPERVRAFLAAHATHTVHTPIAQEGMAC